ncbi:DUF3833 family protein [uncultured Alsobacter sp.]|uniref:DUF3833 family protein n=1 Tax=uncultured Alsobacter sp. TaxID=1748258 RepID=UPI0025D655A3|nr:DUF3833 family protein [uncultured Alsobacter sp.]
MTIDDFTDTTPIFRPEEMLTGELQGWAILTGPLGGLDRRAAIRAQGTHDAASGVIRFTETWTFDDGQVDTLAWRIHPEGQGRYRGEEPTLDGHAKGEAAGCAFHWTYTRDVPAKDGETSRLDFDDWFFRIDETGFCVKGSAGRLGLPFATVFVTYRKL